MLELLLNEMKNDTARKKAMKERMLEIISNALAAELGEENFVITPKKTTVVDEDGNEVDIPKNTIVASVGNVNDVNGFSRDAIVCVTAVAKPWNDSTDKNGNVKIAYTLEDVKQAIEDEEE